MTLDEARLIVQSPNSRTYAEQAEAAALIATSDLATLHDIWKCLFIKGLPAETAAVALHARTGSQYTDFSEFRIDPEEWRELLELPRENPRSLVTISRGFAA
jgi:hypothetical protein